MNMNLRKLNFLFVMPRLMQSVGDGYVFPLGIAYVSSSMKKAGFNVFTLNLNHREGDVFDIIKSMIEENDVHVVATGGFRLSTILLKASSKRLRGSIAIS